MEISEQLEAVVARHAAARRGRARPWSETDAWLIAYPDQFSAPGATPLQVLASVLRRHLAPEINGVHVLPFHPSSSDGGFSVLDHDLVDDRYGDWTDVEALGDEVTLMVDAVINHVSAQGRWFREYLAGDPARAPFFREVSADADVSAVVRPRSSPLSSRFVRDDGTEVDIWTTFGPDQVDLDYREPEVFLAVADLVLGYASRSANAIRLDAVAYVGKQEGTASIHLPQAHAIVRLLRACLDEIDPGVLIVTETNVPHAENVSYLGDGACREAQAVYQFALPPLVLHALATGDAAPLREWASDLAPPPAGTTFLNFLASHDGVGLRPAEGLLSPDDVERLAGLCRSAGGVVNHYRRPDGSEVPYELASTWHDLVAFEHTEAEAHRRHLCSHAVMLALRGLPLLYVHSLFSTANDTTRFAATGAGRDLNRARFTSGDVPASGRESWDAMRTLLRRRGEHPAFHPDAEQRVLASEGGVIGVERVAVDGRRAVVAVNLGEVAAALDLDRGTTWRHLGGGDEVEGRLELPGWSSSWLEPVN